jgi:zinc transport system substrate-binding protein
MRFAATCLASLAIFIGTPLAARADINVVASIKPVHSLVAGVMQGVGEPKLIIDGAASPHTFALKPSQAVALEKADVVFWVGRALETFLEKHLETLSSKARSVELIGAQGLIKYKFREGVAFERHDHAQDAHRHDHKTGAKHVHDTHQGHHQHARTERGARNRYRSNADAHIWLDPVNAKAMVGAIERTLSAVDPGNAATYRRNATAVTKGLDELVVEVSSHVESARGKGFIVFHDSYQYFERRFGLAASGSITVSPEVMPGARRIGELRSKVKTMGAACVFSEPQFQPRLVSTIVEGTSAKTAVLDPLGADLKNGPALYFKLIRQMSRAFKDCLAVAS